MIENKRSYGKREHAKSDDPLPDQVPENCIACGSPNTVLIYNEYYKSKADEDGDAAGLSDIERVREYKCNACGVYFEIDCLDTVREFYTR